MTERVFIGLGSNLSEPRMQLRAAVQSLARIPHTSLLAVSSLYQTRPLGPQDQPDYLNAVALLETELEPEALLDHLQAIEADQGRSRDGERWGARTLDLDILLFGERTINTTRLTIPHAGLHQREFVLYPLNEIAPDQEVPELGVVAELTARCAPNGIERAGALE